MYLVFNQSYCYIFWKCTSWRAKIQRANTNTFLYLGKKSCVLINFSGWAEVRDRAPRPLFSNTLQTSLLSHRAEQLALCVGVGGEASSMSWQCDPIIPGAIKTQSSNFRAQLHLSRRKGERSYDKAYSE